MYDKQLAFVVQAISPAADLWFMSSGNQASQSLAPALSPGQLVLPVP